MNSFEALKYELRRACPGIKLLEQVPMCEHTTFRIGGPVALMALPQTAEETLTAIRVARRMDIRPFLLGRGSNLLCADGAVSRFVIKTNPGLNQIERVGPTELRCGAGVSMREAACFAQRCSLTGLEFAHGIPGTLGGGVVMNAGAYHGELSDVVAETTALNRDGQIVTLRGEEQDFAYRHSAFLDGGMVVLHSILRLQPGDPAAIQARMDRLLYLRRERQPLEWPSAGSTFKRPAGGFAAALIDQCGLKGLTVGGAQVSEKHAGFVINRGGATCSDVLRLTDQIRERVARETGIELELEIRRLS